jgi:NAD(P)-dependent dehydrogenase (short-subunit alcohol dehydrogenase family)
MSTAAPSPARRELQLAGQTVVVVGGSAGIGLETARLANAEGASLVLAARNAERLQQVAGGLSATTTVAFDGTNFESLAQFFDKLPATIDHLLLTGPGPYYAPLADFDFERGRRDIEAHLQRRSGSTGYFRTSEQSTKIEFCRRKDIDEDCGCGSLRS